MDKVRLVTFDIVGTVLRFSRHPVLDYVQVPAPLLLGSSVPVLLCFLDTLLLGSSASLLMDSGDPVLSDMLRYSCSFSCTPVPLLLLLDSCPPDPVILLLLSCAPVLRVLTDSKFGVLLQIQSF